MTPTPYKSGSRHAANAAKKNCDGKKEQLLQ